MVDDLPALRRLLGDLPTGWSAVTLSGEMARSGGSVTGGSSVRESGVLGRERDLRELPDEIARFASQRDGARARRDEATATLRDLGAERTSAGSDRAALIAQRTERSGQRSRLDGWIASLRSQQEQAQHRTATIAEGRASLETEIRDAGIERERIVTILDDLREQHRQQVETLADARESLSEQTSSLNKARQHLATLDERLRAEERQAATLQRQRQGQADELAIRDRRLAEIDGDRTALNDQRERLQREVTQLTGVQDAAIAERGPLAESVTGTGRAMTSLTATIDATRQDLVERERTLHQGSLAVERARAELGTIHQRIVDDLELEDPDDLLTAPVPDYLTNGFLLPTRPRLSAKSAVSATGCGGLATPATMWSRSSSANPPMSPTSPPNSPMSRKPRGRSGRCWPT